MKKYSVYINDTKIFDCVTTKKDIRKLGKQLIHELNKGEKLIITED